MVLGDILRRSGRNKNALYLGAPEAEADAGPASRMPLGKVYEDCHNLTEALTHEKFVIVGRKGSGKSAYAEYLSELAGSEPNLFCTFVRAADFNLEQLVQLGRAMGDPIEIEPLFRWLIYTHLLRTFANSAAVASNRDYELLRQFLDKNSGYIDIRDFEIRELVQKHGFEVSVEYFKRFLSGRYKRDVEAKSGRAPFYKLLPHLEEVITKVLCSPEEKANKNSYVVFFDDLDIGFSGDRPSSCDALVQLLRACRHVNQEVFARHGVLAKAVMLLRDDIETHLSSKYPDTAKLFASYTATLNWYQDQFASPGTDENSLNLKKFINRRITYAFQRVGISFNKQDPWSSLVDAGAVEADRSSFRHVVTQTLFRPRDLLLFFRPLDSSGWTYPLDRMALNRLSDSYAAELSKEIKNELSSFYTAIQIENIFMAISAFAKYNARYDDAIKCIHEYCKGVEPSSLLEYLFDRSIIGTVDDMGRFYFRCRQPVNTPAPISFDHGQKIVVQYAVRRYVNSRKYS